MFSSGTPWHCGTLWRHPDVGELGLLLLFQLPAGDPEEEEAVILQDGNVELSHLVVSQCAVGQLHVDVPRRVGHHHGKLAQDGHVQVADIAADPLERRKKNFCQHLSTSPPFSSLTRPHLRWEQFAHVAVRVPRVKPQLRGPGLGPQQAPLGLRGAVDLVVDVLAGVHVETGVEEGAVAEALVCVLVDDAPEREHWGAQSEPAA